MVPFSLSSSAVICSPKFPLSFPSPNESENPNSVVVSLNSRPPTKKLLMRYCFAYSSRAVIKCFSQKQPAEQQQLVEENEEVYEFERLFSNLNQATLNREPGKSYIQERSIFFLHGVRKG